MQTLTEKILHRLLQESSLVPAHLAAIQTVNAPSRKEAVIYDIDEIEQWLQIIVQDGGTSYALEAMRGFISIRKPAHPCDEAWEVIMSVGPGYGKLVYGLAYAMSPTGKLISDRASVSDDAQRGWQRAEKERISTELDSITPPHKTPPKEDDCRLYNQPGKEFLDRAYVAQGWETGALKTLKVNHNKMVRRNGLTHKEEYDLIEALRTLSVVFFNKNYEQES